MSKWLQNEQSQALFKHVCKQTLTVHAPEEMPLFEEIYALYEASVAEGEVETGGTSDSPFGFSGDGGLVLLVLLPMAGLLFSALALNLGLTRLNEFRQLSDEEVENTINTMDWTSNNSELLRTLTQKLTESD